MSAAGCIAADEEASELIAAAGGDRDRLERFVERRCLGEPLEWIVGSVEFCGTTVRIVPGVYVPRWHTELLVRRAAERACPNGLVVDLCTGSGAVATALTVMRPDVRVVATELDAHAAACASGNGVDVRVGYLDDPLPRDLAGTVDLIIAVVPYVPTTEMKLLPRDVQAYEPTLALDGGDGGTVLLERVIERSGHWLRPGGWLVLELGGDQAAPMLRRMEQRGFTRTGVIRDAEDDDRGIEGCLSR